MSPYQEHQSRHRRITILKVLSESQEYRCGDALLWDLVATYVPSTRDQIRSDLAWLAENGLVSLRVISTATIATMTERGGDIAAGRSTDPGVARPSPRG